MTDARTGRQRPTRYLLGFETGFPPPGSGDPDPGDSAPFDAIDTEIPCPDLRHGETSEKTLQGNDLSPESPPEPCLDPGHGSVSHSDANPCLKNGDLRVSKRDTNPVREPLRKPVKEEEGAQGRAGVPDDFFEKLLQALGLDPSALPGWWQGASARAHVQRWCDDLGLGEDAVLSVAEESRHDHPTPPDGPKALDRAMQRAAGRLKQSSATIAAKGPGTGNETRRRQRDDAPRPSADAVLAFYADLVNSERFLPASTISNTIRDAMLARGLVTAERVRSRGVR